MKGDLFADLEESIIKNFKGKRTILFVVLFFAAIATRNAKATPEAPRNMAALGDSITAGALAAFQRTDAHNPLALPKFLYYIGLYGFERTMTAFEARENSWSTGMGKQVRSQARRLYEIPADRDDNFVSLNAAVSGAISTDVGAQVASVLDWAQTLGQDAPDYVTVEIGANDACAKTNDDMTSAADYGDSLRAAIKTLLENNPRTRVFLGGIPNIEHLRDVAYNSWLGLPPLPAFCHDLWSQVKICPNMLNEADADKRAEVTRRVRAYMHELDVLTQDFNDQYGEDRVRFGSEIYDYAFTDKEISIDCFHPDPIGQQALSDITWKKNWWYKLNPR